MAISGELHLPLESGGAATRLDAAAAGHVNTLVDLYRNHQQRIYRYCLALLRNPDDAEDATQETFTRAAPFLPNLPGDLSAYLTTVARNICCDVVRARARRAVPIDTVPLADRKVSPERQSIDWDVVRRMWRQLSPSERLLFAYTFAGYKYEEIASRTGMSRPSVSVGLARARRRLRDLAAATGTLGLLPLGIRRLLDRAGRRVSNAMSSTQTAFLGMVDQVGAIAAGLLSGLFVLSASTTPVAAPPMLATAAQRATVGAGAASAGTPAVALATSTALAATGTGQRPSSHAPSPSPASALQGLPAGLGSDIPGATASPDDTRVRSFAASPNFTNDRIVFVAGPVSNGCPAAVACSGLYRSADAGVHWNRLAYLSSPGADTLLLPPSYPADPVLFVVLQNAELEEISDGTASAASVPWTLPGVTAAAIAPDSTAGHETVATVIGQMVEEFVAGNSIPTATAALPANLTPLGIVFGSTGTVIVNGWVPDSTGASVAAAAVCPLSGVCEQPVLFNDTSGYVVQMAASPTVGVDHVVAVAGAGALYVSTDAGQSFREVRKASGGISFDSVSIGHGPAGLRIVVSTKAARPVLMSDDLGATFTDITGNLDDPSGIIDSAAYPDGTILAATLNDAQGRSLLRQTTGNGAWINPS